jgi:hypothetical protein
MSDSHTPPVADSSDKLAWTIFSLAGSGAVAFLVIVYIFVLR